MKWGILVLLLLGIVAAVCAAMLVGAFKLDFFSTGGNSLPKTVTVVVAAKDLSDSTWITSDSIAKKEVPAAEVSAAKRAEGLVSEASVIDRVLRMGVVKDTILTEASFVPQGSAEETIAKMPEGYGAFPVLLRGTSPDRTLLRPGCIVDVVSASRDGSRSGRQIGKVLLSRIRVLVVNGESIGDSGQGKNRSTQRGAMQGLSVTLMVTDQQATALYMAIQEGSIALLLRNRNDKTKPFMYPIIIDDGGNIVPMNPERLNPDSEQSNLIDPNQTAQSQSTSEGRPPPVEKHTVIMMKGTETTTKELEIPKSGDASGGTEER